MNQTARSEEPLVAIILKGLSILSTLGAVLFYIAMFRHDVPLDASAQTILTAAASVAGDQVRAYTLTGTAIALWWMGEIIALLARIAANGSRQPEPLKSSSPQKRIAEPSSGTGSRSRRDDEDEVPRYTL